MFWFSLSKFKTKKKMTSGSFTHDTSLTVPSSKGIYPYETCIVYFYIFRLQT